MTDEMTAILCRALEELPQNLGRLNIKLGKEGVGDSSPKKLDLKELHKISLPWLSVGLDEDGDLLPKKKRRHFAEDAFTIYVKTLTSTTQALQVQPQDKVRDVKVLLREKLGIPIGDQRLIFQGKNLEDEHILSDYKIRDVTTLHLIKRMSGGGAPVAYTLDPKFRDPEWDFDFTWVKDKKPFYRGGLPYYRPCGWRRIALKVTGVYDSDAWLGSPGLRLESDEEEWPVSYHGTDFQMAKLTAKQGSQLKKCQHPQCREGIYSTPNPDIAAQYAATFQHQGCTYQIMMQNRINAKKSIFHKEEEYYVTPNDDNIRMYGILIRKFQG